VLIKNTSIKFSNKVDAKIKTIKFMRYKKNYNKQLWLKYFNSARVSLWCIITFAKHHNGHCQLGPSITATDCTYLYTLVSYLYRTSKYIIKYQEFNFMQIIINIIINIVRHNPNLLKRKKPLSEHDLLCINTPSSKLGQGGWVECDENY